MRYPRKLRDRLAALTVNPDSTIEQAMQCIDRSGGIIAVVIDRERLAGLITNGDIRRGILRGKSLLTPVTQVMNEKPLTLQKTDLANAQTVLATIRVMEDNGMDILPIVDGDKRLVDLLTIEEARLYLSQPAAGDASFSRQRVLLVGGGGYIGSVLTQRLLEAGYRVRVADRLLYGSSAVDSFSGNKNYEFKQCDVRHLEEVIDLVEDVYAVVYLAEIVGDPACGLSPKLTLETNHLAVLSFATLCSHLQVNRFIYLSSCSIYGASENPDEWLSEDSAPNPVSLYASMKIRTERALLRLAEESQNFSPLMLRLATVFGLSPRLRLDLVVNALTAQALRMGEITVYGGKQWRPIIHVRDVARAIANMLEAPLESVRGQVFNLGDNNWNFTIDKIGEIVKDLIPGTRLIVRQDDQDVRNYRVTFDKIRIQTGFNAEVTIQEGIRELKSFIEANPVDPNDPRCHNFRFLNLKLASKKDGIYEPVA